MENNGKLQQSREKRRSYSSFLDVQDEREKDVFRFLVKNSGCISLEEFKEKYPPLSDDFDDWLLEEKKILAFYKIGDRIIHIIPFLRDATFCTDHINYVTRCELEDCKRFHVCRYHLNSYCNYGAMCRNGHTFTVGNNEEIKNKLGLNGFSDGEILTILKCRYPQVCPADHCESEVPDECPYLHICYFFTQGKCKDPSCTRGHSLEDPHNKWVLSVYGMEEWPSQRPEIFKAAITLRRKREPASSHFSSSSEGNGSETGDSLLEGLVKQMKEEKRKEDED
ncbi:uncharacterized protein LOC134242949 [Saccostrea cucullata]|uniref:uncharacterized protein LOC134242949 n=1 Tax=Saccostrea cuccullata TaxID=36930 RepID=UPI002ED63F46